MTKVLITESHLSDIATAIRTKDGTSTTMTPAQMASRISAIPSGGVTPTGTRDIYQNGSYDVTDYASVYVNTNYQPSQDLRSVKYASFVGN